jgi:serine/threonine protein kinase/Tfp pilus assembly protein PilF
VLCELIRIDLEYGWESNRPRSLDDYRRDFPGLFDDPDSVQEIAFEEYRLRRRAGQAPSPQEYARRYGVNIEGWPTPTPQEASEQLSIRLEEASRTYRAFRLAPPRQEVTDEPDPLDPPSIDLDDRLMLTGVGEFACLFRELKAHDENLAGQVADSLSSFPKSGEEFYGFQLIDELGRGAFGRVYLAKQASLAKRPVALKVSPDVGAESQTLAQLQHTHVVPIYSVHRAGVFQSVCMPYCGSVTVADVVRDLQSRPRRPRHGLELLRVLPVKSRPAGVQAPDGPSEPVRAELGKLTYAEAVLWLGARLASGLQHAHERGILHRDVKPANILITDEGLPMLLDFNVSEDLKQRGASAAMVGGTLPYMAPEMLEAFKGDDHTSAGAGSAGPPQADGRCDVWSLGLVLFELLTGRFPFSPPRTTAAEAQEHGMSGVLTRMLQERREGPPDPRRIEPPLSPATASIIRHCLEPDPARRYPTARALQDDLERQLADLPLRHAPEPSFRERAAKWRRRNRQLSVQLGAVAAVLALLAAGGMYSWARAIQRTDKARQVRDEFQGKRWDAEFLLAKRPDSRDQLDRGETDCRTALGLYGVLKDGRWQERPELTALPAKERADLRAEVAELLYLLAWTLKENGEARAAEAESCRRLAEECFGHEEDPLGRSSESIYKVTIKARDLTADERFSEAMALLEPVVKEQPWHFKAQLLLGRCYFGLGKYHEAVSCYTACIALKPNLYGSYASRGEAYLVLGEWKAAKDDFDRVIELKPKRAETYIDRAIAREHLKDLKGKKDLKGAEADLTAALELGIPFTRIFFFRSRIRKEMGDKKGARNDFQEGMRREPTEELSWNARGYARMNNGDMDGALADFDRALAINPTLRYALMNKVHVLAVIQRKNTEARQILERVLEYSPEHSPALAALAVVLARLGETKLAHQRIAQALDRNIGPKIQYQAACVYALTSKKKPDDADQAIMHLRLALRDPQLGENPETDEDLASLRGKPAFTRLMRGFKLIDQRPAPNGTTGS